MDVLNRLRGAPADEQHERTNTLNDEQRASYVEGLRRERAVFCAAGEYEQVGHVNAEIASALGVSLEEAAEDAPAIIPREYEHGAPNGVRLAAPAGPIDRRSTPAEAMAELAAMDARLIAENPPCDDPLRGARSKLFAAIRANQPFPEPLPVCSIGHQGPIPPNEPWGFKKGNPFVRKRTSLPGAKGPIITDPVEARRKESRRIEREREEAASSE